jgi:hypothetical protein
MGRGLGKLSKRPRGGPNPLSCEPREACAANTRVVGATGGGLPSKDHARVPSAMVMPFGFPSQPAMSGPEPLVARPRVLWVGPNSAAELHIARWQVSSLAEILTAASPAEAAREPPEVFCNASPAVILLASPTPAAWSLDDLVMLRIAWPLAPIVSVASTLLDGRRRSGPTLAGVEEVPWHDLAARLAWWLADRAGGRPGTLGLPATVRREERFLEVAGLLPTEPRPRVAVTARRKGELDASCDLVAAAGGLVTDAVVGRPGLETDADVLVWDILTPDDADLAWLRMLVAQRPGRKIIVLESFPRADRVAAILRAGVIAVLGRPGSAEALAGVLLQTANPSGIGLGSRLIGP